MCEKFHARIFERPFYRENEGTKKFLDECEKLGLVIKTVHAGGHADAETIRKLIEYVSPDEIVPIHTEKPEWFEHKIIL